MAWVNSLRLSLRGDMSQFSKERPVSPPFSTCLPLILKVYRLLLCSTATSTVTDTHAVCKYVIPHLCVDQSNIQTDPG